MTLTVSRLTRAIAVTAVSLLVACPVSGGHYTWTTQGPETGFVKQILVDSESSDRLLASAGFWGPFLFRTTNRGGNWTYQEGTAGIGRIVSDSSNPGVLYVPAGREVLKSVDFGASWFPSSEGLPEGVAIWAVGVAPSVPSTVYAIAAKSVSDIYRSEDSGATWMFVASSLAASYVRELVVDPGDANVLYVSVNLDVVKSVDGGLSFTPTGLNRDTRRLAADARSPMALYAGTDSGVFKSVDSGTSWVPANVGIADHLIWDLAFDPIDPQRVFAASTGSGSGTDGGPYLSVDGGQSWSLIDLGLPVNVATAVAMDPRDPALVYVGAGLGWGREKVFASDDGGATWALASAGISGFYSPAVCTHPTEGGVAFSAAGADVFRTDSSGAGWARTGAATHGLVALAADPSNLDTLYAGFGNVQPGQDGVVKSTDGGATWNLATNGLAVSGFYRLAISAASPAHLLATSIDGLFGTTNGGGLWSPLLTTGGVRAAAFDSADPSIIYASPGLSMVLESQLLRTSNGGVDWDPPAGFPTPFLASDIVVGPTDPTRVYAVGHGDVYRSVDRGLTFAPASDGLPLSGVSPYRLVADPAAAGTLYVQTISVPDTLAATAPQFNVYWTNDDAGTWKPLPGFLPTLSTVADFAISATGRTVYAATASGVFQFDRSFLDVADADPFWTAIDAAAMNSVTAGCGGGNFCPRVPVSRASIAAFLLRGKYGPAYEPPPATGVVFSDVPAYSLAAVFIEQLFAEGITSGCGGGAYCPVAPVTRAQFAVFLLKTEHGFDYQPPPATGTVFADVPVDAFAAAWIEQLAAEGVTAGCGSGNFCPGDSVLRSQAAALVVRALGLS